jgi:hypothetical protein
MTPFAPFARSRRVSLAIGSMLGLLIAQSFSAAVAAADTSAGLLAGDKSSDIFFHAAGAVLLTLLPQALASQASTWEVIYGGCTFSDGPSGALARSGSCKGQSGQLNLASRGIASVPEGVFEDMGLTR